MDYLQKILIDIETQSVEGIKECFQNGIDPNATFRKKPLVYEVINGYPRGPKFKECINVFVDHGLVFEDKVLLATLLDDAAFLDTVLMKNPMEIKRIHSLECAFTPLYQVTLLHICAEYNHVSCAKVLVKHGADINSMAGVDQYGFGGQTPIFHTDNQNENKCIDMMHYLLTKSADLNYTVKGLTWGKGYEWETFVPAVNPISYAMMGLLRQFQRKESDIYQIVSTLLKARYGIDYTPTNIPNAYLDN